MSKSNSIDVSLLEIFKIFFIIGIQLLGGGYVIVPLLKKYIVDERHWMSDEELVDFFAMSQCIPGIIAGNIAVCAGYRAKGILGAVMALLGIIVPCFICILILAHILTGIIDYPIIQSAFKGIRISVVILVFVTIKDLWQKSVNSLFTYILFLIILTSLFCIHISPAIIIIMAGLTALIYGKLKGVKHA